ncbi:VldL [Streptomyces albus]|uniref:VldL n=1 Tax=Streptomyces albus (strain ATCC 21838 / DSM 41398 / FERM P-419 / JCM 4703 / NBRC 107858) TaxID=1081613 RepID=A0A0B5F084_STRA4|nr:VldL [Streptomyces albus]AOU81793.1 VldL [Streptomyces albus]AYN37480.1 VldL [Streptomyces albus]
MEFERDKFDPEVFFAEHWRKKPLYVQGGAADFLRRSWTPQDFGAALRAAREADHTVLEREGEVAFVEKVSLFDADLAERAEEFGRFFGVPETWFDSVATYSPSGIGDHFDHSDNFVLQQEGVKEWSLASPSHLPKTEIARRMMNLPGVGGYDLPTHDRAEFVLEPGDLLYIPLLWLHSGVSRASSLSLSLVFPAVSLYSAVVPLLGQVLRGRALGHQPLPAFHSGLSDDERRRAVEAVRTATAALIGRMADEEIVDAVHELQKQWLLPQP